VPALARHTPASTAVLIGLLDWLLVCRLKNGDIFQAFNLDPSFYPEYNEESARFIAHSILSAMAHLHKNDVIHGDITVRDAGGDASRLNLAHEADNGGSQPENILSDSDKVIKLGGFSNACRRVGDELKDGQLIGNVAFQAPEVLLQAPFGKSTDVWSFGCLVFFLYVVCLCARTHSFTQSSLTHSLTLAG